MVITDRHWLLYCLSKIPDIPIGGNGSIKAMTWPQKGTKSANIKFCTSMKDEVYFTKITKIRSETNLTGEPSKTDLYVRAK